jgi:hypothetical protein
MMAQQNRIILISGVVSVLLGFSAGFLGGRLAAPPVTEKSAASVIRAECFQLTDANGLTRGRFEVDPRGIARMALGDQEGSSRISLATGPQGGASLQMSDEKHQSAVVLKTEPQGSQTIALFHEGKPRVALEVQKNGDPAINLYDKSRRLIGLGLTSQGDLHLSFFGENQKVALELLSKKNGDRSLTLDGKDGIPRIVLGLKNDQKAALGLFDSQGKTRVALMDEPSLFLLKKGKVLRTLP